MLAGSSVGQLAGVATSVLVHARIKPEVVTALVLGIPSVLGLVVILLSGRRWVTTLGAFILALAPGWFGVLILLRVVAGG